MLRVQETIAAGLVSIALGSLLAASLATTASALAQEEDSPPAPSLRLTQPRVEARLSDTPPDESDARAEPLVIGEVPPLAMRSRDASPFRLLGSRQPVIRLANTPKMFGDLFSNFGSVETVVAGTLIPVGPASDLPMAGGSRRVKVSENNNAIPTDRLFALYNHFHNALEATGPSPSSHHVDRYTVGFEKTFWDQMASIQVQLPLVNRYEYAFPAAGPPLFGVESGHVGNLSIFAKGLLYYTEAYALSAGLGIDLPTGSSVTGTLANYDFGVENESVHLLPYVGLTGTSSEDSFYNAFMQLDIAANGNELNYFDRLTNVGGSLGEYHEQTLLHLDLGVGHWLYRDPCAWIQGLAAIAEVHYTTTLQDTDDVLAVLPPGAAALRFTSPGNRVDVVNGTFGLHANVGDRSELRTAVVAPLRGGDNRYFDAELQVQWNLRF